jgi:hypothetical protein
MGLPVVLRRDKISSLKLRKNKNAGCFKNSTCRRTAESNVGEIKEARREMSNVRLRILSLTSSLITPDVNSASYQDQQVKYTRQEQHITRMDHIRQHSTCVGKSEIEMYFKQVVCVCARNVLG